MIRRRFLDWSIYRHAETKCSAAEKLNADGSMELDVRKIRDKEEEPQRNYNFYYSCTINPKPIRNRKIGIHSSRYLATSRLFQVSPTVAVPFAQQ